MVVRFLPQNNEGDNHRDDHTILAEVIQLRTGKTWWDPVRHASEQKNTPTVLSSSTRQQFTGTKTVNTRQNRTALSTGDPSDHEPLYNKTQQKESPSQHSAYDEGVRVLARRARTSQELHDELVRRGYEAYTVEEVINEFQRNCYLDDEGLARILTEQLRETQQASQAQIRTKLRERKLSDEIIDAAIGEVDPDQEYEMLRTIAADRARKINGLDRRTAERRLLAFLARRGWGGEPAIRATREALDNCDTTKNAARVAPPQTMTRSHPPRSHPTMGSSKSR